MSLFKVLRGDSTRIDTETTPFHDGYAYFTPDDAGFYIDAEVAGAQKRVRINQPTRTVGATLLAAGWSTGTQVISIDELTAQDNGMISLIESATDAQRAAGAAADLRIVSQSAGALTVEAHGVVPSIDIPVTVVIFS